MANGAATNEMDFAAMETAVADFETTTENVDSTLKKLDAIIQDTISSGSKVFEGELAQNCKKKWDDYALKFNNVISACRTQANNSRLALEEHKQADQSKIQ